LPPRLKWPTSTPLTGLPRHRTRARIWRPRHAATRPAAAAAAAAPIARQVYARGAPRQWARAKHCAWVLQRRELEAWAPRDAADVVLVADDGGLLEGLVTNLFVVAGERVARRGCGKGRPGAARPRAYP
jgi:branched-subunit amino acid aminotransferase/4-amino-4-deoxychorismate lyase